MIQNLQIGDRLIRTKGGIFTRHHAIFVGNNTVAENQRGFGVRYISLTQFLNDGILEEVINYNFDYSSQRIILQRIQNKIGTAYSLFTYNCEHFANEVLKSKPTSKQVRNGVGISLSILALVLLTKKSKKVA
jgi:hypothetical protein